MKKNQIHVLLPEAMSGFKGLERRINQAKIHHLDSRSSEPVANDPAITFEALFESFELWPVGVQADAEESNTKRSFCFDLHFMRRNSFAWFNKPTATPAMFETKNLTRAGSSNNCMRISNHFIIRPNPGFEAVDVKYLMTGT